MGPRFVQSSAVPQRPVSVPAARYSGDLVVHGIPSRLSSGQRYGRQDQLHQDGEDTQAGISFRVRICGFDERAEDCRKGDRSSMKVRRAEVGEAPDVMRVINDAFRPAESFFVEGDRIGLEQVREHFGKGVFLVTEDLGGVVYVELRGERAYFGLLSVDPAKQGSGMGKKLIAAA